MLSERFKEIADEYSRSLEDGDELRISMPRAGDIEDTDLTMFQIVREETYKLFCGSSDEDKAARQELGSDVAKISSYICGGAAVALVAAGVAIPIVTLTAAVSLILSITMRVGHRSLCRYANRFGLS